MMLHQKSNKFLILIENKNETLDLNECEKKRKLPEYQLNYTLHIQQMLFVNEIITPYFPFIHHL